ncbi:helix-turn-helix transcriptional regulator [Halorhodospira neutriphila]|uniref:DNA-binding protein n=1 Tax=Halorhodospira neutriphila TaxID=168379 RepID=A0ABS1E7E7_9GAMM|nr:AlpA family transcriptional regulator [Halorhodospira neutriphila]MBK1727099.1 DNA-binding protein [Halorhodospira neutriphila]
MTETSRGDRILRRPEVESRVGLGRSAIYKAMQRGEFPRPIRLTSRAVGWRQSDIEAWLASRAASGREC